MLWVPIYIVVVVVAAVAVKGWDENELDFGRVLIYVRRFCWSFRVYVRRIRSRKQDFCLVSARKC